ncbi:hypothetical protein C0993_002606, partial [Termitomyces sp. T159_Od127]
LIKLCKIHNIKASGKNTELIEKLKKVAETLPKDAPLSIAARSERFTDNSGGDEGSEAVHDTTTEQLQSAHARWGFQMPRPSEQWDVVMENIEEVDEKSSQGTLDSLRTIGNGGSDEFGTVMSKSLNASSSLKFLASSLSLKRGSVSKATTSSTCFLPYSSSKSPLQMSPTPSGNDILAETSTPSSLRDTGAHLQTDPFTFDSMPSNQISSTNNPLPLPGHCLRPGVPAPSDARLSLGLNEPSTPTRKQATTTIRLISDPASNNDSYGLTPQLQPFKTSFDLDFGSPQPSGGFSGVSLWPPNEGEQKKGIYPPLPLEDLIDSFHGGLGPVSSTKYPPDDMKVDASIPDLLASPKPSIPSLLSHTLKSTTTTQLAVPDPFIFGSPLPQHRVSDLQFKSAAASVLEEMNKRLQQDGVDGIGLDLVTKLQPGAHAVGAGILGPLEEKELPKTKIYKEKFDKLHEEDFSKMEGIDSLVRRRGLLGKEREGPGLIVKNRKLSASGVAGHGFGRDRFGRRIGGESGRLSAATMVNESRERRRSRIIPGAFGDDDGEEETGAREGDAELTPGKEEDHREGDKTMTGEDREKAKAEGEQMHKEREAIKKLELNKVRRKSSAVGARGRVSIGRGGQAVKPQPASRSKPSKFGFLSSAKSLVAKVWGGGKTATSATSATTSGTPKPTTTKGPKSASTSSPASALAPAAAPLKKVSAPVRPSTINPPVNRVYSLRGKDNVTATISSTTSSLHSQLPLPSNTTAISNTRGSATKSGTGPSGPSVSTLEIRSSLASTGRSSSSGTVGSMGSRKIVTGSGSHSASLNVVTGAAIGSSSSSRTSSKLSSSRLLAPTASSLAKAVVNKPSVTGSKASLKSAMEASGVQIRKSQSSGSDTLSMITNSAQMSREPWSPRPKRIFSKPLAVPCGIPTLTRKHPTATTKDDTMAKEDAKEAENVIAPIKQRSLNGRKPRISRSKVIAKLASQRAAGASRPGSTPGAKTGRTRSSLGVKAQRSSYGGKSVGVKGVEDSVLMSAKKRVRQSEYARRKSHAASVDPKEADKMNVDGE